MSRILSVQKLYGKPGRFAVLLDCGHSIELELPRWPKRLAEVSCSACTGEELAGLPAGCEEIDST